MNRVVISYWTGRSTRNLFRLLRQIHSYDAGAPFEVVVVCNGGDKLPLRLPLRFRKYKISVLDRVNSGFNIGAWDHGWRHAARCDHFLFLQDECYIKRPGWLRAFVARMEGSSGIGLVGESMNWNVSWDQQRDNPVASRCLNREGYPEFNAIDFLRAFLEREGIPTDESARHLQSLVLFASRRVLEDMGGFLHKDNYADAVGAEIAISKKVISMGYDIATVGPESFHYIGHTEWSHVPTRAMKRFRLALRPFKARLEAALGRGML